MPLKSEEKRSEYAIRLNDKVPSVPLRVAVAGMNRMLRAYSRMDEKLEEDGFPEDRE